MKNKPFFTIIFLALFSLSSCEYVKQAEIIRKQAQEKKGRPTKIESIVRIFMHTSRSFSFLIEQPGSKELRFIEAAGIPRFFKDVPPEQNMWALAYPRDSQKGTIERLEIHMHTETDINGAGWDHGKHGSGQTTVLE